jgi:hypothetical protein
MLMITNPLNPDRPFEDHWMDDRAAARRLLEPSMLFELSTLSVGSTASAPLRAGPITHQVA